MYKHASRLSIVIAGDLSKDPEIILDFNDATHEMYVLLSGEVELFLKVCSEHNSSCFAWYCILRRDK
jgi:signal-transduction protein with cAMP-binding, CBS, and nucleotidyltransferase domain